MEDSKKKILFPKLQKKIKGFLTDESGKISKKDALGLSAISLALIAAEDVHADVKPYSIPRTGPNPGPNVGITVTTNAPVSGNVNGHYS